MEMLWMTLLVVFLCGIMARFHAISTDIGPLFIQPNKLYATLAVATLGIIAGLRNNIGDTFLYMHGYRVNDFSFQTILQQDDIGFNLLQLLLKSISSDPQILIFTTAIITNALIGIVLYHYARLYELSLYAYITTGAFIVSMNGIRQYFAAAIIFVATKALLDGKWKLYTGIVVFASLFHLSALIMLPLYFLVRRRAWTWTTFGLITLAILIVVGYNYFSSAFFSVIENTQYGHYQQFQQGGANVLRVAIFCIPLVIAFMGREKLRSIFPGSDVFVNLTIIGAVIMIISTQNWIFARLSIYFNLYQIVLIGWMVKLFREKDQKFIYMVVICFYFLYFFYENVLMLDIRYNSHFINWPFG